MPRSKLFVLPVLLVWACSTGKEPPPEPSSRDGLRPLTSRERGTGGSEATPRSDPNPGPSALPPGHPPLSPEPVPGHGMPGEGSTAFVHGGVAGSIALEPALTSRLARADVLYVIARDPGTRAVVAVRRIERPSFPVSFELGAEDAMGAGVRTKGPLEIIARISKSGDAIASPGDLEGQTAGVSFGDRGVSITIDSVRP